MTPHLDVNDAGSAEVRGPTRSFDDRPLLVFWETTKACLLTCRHCRANAQRDPGSDDISTDEGLALIDDLAAIGRPRPIMILTGGDCLMRNDLVALAAHAKQMDVPVAIAPSVTPKLTPTILRQLRAQSIKTASLSLDGATPDTHEAVRGVNGHFDATMDAINNLKVHGYTVQVNTTVMRCNVAELADIASLLQRSGVNVWEVFFLIATGRGNRIEATSARENEDICHFLVDASRYGFTVRTVEAPFFRRVVVDRRRIGDVPPEHAFELGPLYSHLATAFTRNWDYPPRPYAPRALQPATARASSSSPTTATSIRRDSYLYDSAVSANKASWRSIGTIFCCIRSGMPTSPEGAAHVSTQISVVAREPGLSRPPGTRLERIPGASEHSPMSANSGASSGKVHLSTSEPLGHGSRIRLISKEPPNRTKRAFDIKSILTLFRQQGRGQGCSMSDESVADAPQGDSTAGW